MYIYIYIYKYIYICVCVFIYNIYILYILFNNIIFQINHKSRILLKCKYIFKKKAKTTKILKCIKHLLKVKTYKTYNVSLSTTA